MTKTAEKVLAETERFHMVLPELLRRLPGRWVVFRDGQVKSDHKTEDEAYGAAVEKFGVDGAFVIAPVVEVTPTPITAGVLYGMA